MLVKSISLVAAMSLVQDLGYNRQHTVHEFAFTRCLVIPEDSTLCEMKCELVQGIWYQFLSFRDEGVFQMEL